MCVSMIYLSASFIRVSLVYTFTHCMCVSMIYLSAYLSIVCLSTTYFPFIWCLEGNSSSIRELVFKDSNIHHASASA